MDSEDIKLCLYGYFLYKRHWKVADEIYVYPFEIADIIVDTGKEIREVEIKISKSDLWNGEKRKNKHKEAYSGDNIIGKPNKFYICVPECLKDEALEWINKTNIKYGLYICKDIHNTNIGWWGDFIITVKQAKQINKVYNKNSWDYKFINRLNNIAYKYYMELHNKKNV